MLWVYMNVEIKCAKIFLQNYKSLKKYILVLCFVVLWHSTFLYWDGSVSFLWSWDGSVSLDVERESMVP